ncbi:hypothetical protein J6590_082060 [Homalodisca vitripennis]|nr:hypothetical protein J6590_082060 [Homalodisca vitripennis]
MVDTSRPYKTSWSTAQDKDLSSMTQMLDILNTSSLQAQNRFLVTGKECDKLEASRKNKSYDAPEEPLVKSLESGATLCVAYLFLSRFDCLNHKLILEKPRTFGVDGSELACFKS